MGFNTLEGLYDFVEANVAKAKKQYEITRDFKRLANESSDEEIKNKIKWESFVFDFIMEEGKVKPVHSSVKEDGTTIFEYPSYQDFNEAAYLYLKERTKVVKNDFLIARYNQILWNSDTEHKHLLQGKNAVDAYYRLLNKLDCVKEEKSGGWDCLDILKNGFSLALQTKYKVDEYKKMIHSFLFEKGKFHQDLKIYILKYLLQLPQTKPKDLEGTLDLVKKIGAAKKRKKPDYFATKEIYLTGLAIAQKCKSDTKIWNKYIGDSIVRMAESRMDDETKMIPLSFYKEAIPYYKLAGQNKKAKQIEQKYFETKKLLKLTIIELPFDEEANKTLNDYYDAKAKVLLKREPKDIFGYFLVGEDFLPNKEFLLSMARNKESAFLDLVTTMKFDINKNVSRQKDSKADIEKAKVYEHYHNFVRTSVLPFLHRVFIDGIIQNKITYKNLITFIIENTWFGQELSETDSGGDLIKYRWVSLLSPSIHEYFVQIESALKSNNPYTNFVMPIDSLTLKFEGVLRDFAALIGVTTTITGKGNVLREKYIEELLVDKEIKKYFNEDDLLFFNYLFVSKDGMNLRNNIAHSFFKPQNYSFQMMHLLICAFMRIGKYKIKLND